MPASKHWRNSCECEKKKFNEPRVESVMTSLLCICNVLLILYRYANVYLRSIYSIYILPSFKSLFVLKFQGRVFWRLMCLPFCAVTNLFSHCHSSTKECERKSLIVFNYVGEIIKTHFSSRVRKILRKFIYCLRFSMNSKKPAALFRIIGT